MDRIWRWVAVITVTMMIFALVLIGVAYFTGGSVERLMSTTDIADMTKFLTRDQLEYYVTAVFRFFGAT